MIPPPIAVLVADCEHSYLYGACTIPATRACTYAYTPTRPHAYAHAHAHAHMMDIRYSEGDLAEFQKKYLSRTVLGYNLETVTIKNRGDDGGA